MSEQPLTRRRFGALMTAVVGCGLARCGGTDTSSVRTTIDVRPSASSTTKAVGTHLLGFEGQRGGVFTVPEAAKHGPVGLVVLLHGAGGSGAGIVRRFENVLRQAQVAVVAPDSVGGTWDAILGEQRTLVDVFTHRRDMGFGADAASLEMTLRSVFESVAIDPARMAIAGFSDGATYALSLGLENGELFRRIIAFSPGFITTGPRRGRPEVFISHGSRDDVLPVDRCSRVIVPALQRDGYVVTYREFDGGHDVPDSIAREGIAWGVSPANAPLTPSRE